MDIGKECYVISGYSSQGGVFLSRIFVDCDFSRGRDLSTARKWALSEIERMNKAGATVSLVYQQLNEETRTWEERDDPLK